MSQNMLGADNVRSPYLRAVKLNTVIVFGSSGSVSQQTPSDASGLTFSKPSGTGLYRVTTENQYGQLIGISAMHYNQSTKREATWELDAEYGENTAKVLDLLYVKAASAANVDSGDKLYLELTFGASDVGPQITPA